MAECLQILPQTFSKGLRADHLFIRILIGPFADFRCKLFCFVRKHIIGRDFIRQRVQTGSALRSIQFAGGLCSEAE